MVQTCGQDVLFRRAFEDKDLNFKYGNAENMTCYDNTEDPHVKTHLQNDFTPYFDGGTRRPVD